MPTGHHATATPRRAASGRRLRSFPSASASSSSFATTPISTTRPSPRRSASRPEPWPQRCTRPVGPCAADSRRFTREWSRSHGPDDPRRLEDHLARAELGRRAGSGRRAPAPRGRSHAPERSRDGPCAARRRARGTTVRHRRAPEGPDHGLQPSRPSPGHHPRHGGRHPRRHLLGPHLAALRHGRAAAQPRSSPVLSPAGASHRHDPGAVDALPRAAGHRCPRGARRRRTTACARPALHGVLSPDAGHAPARTRRVRGAARRPRSDRCHHYRGHGSWSREAANSGATVDRLPRGRGRYPAAVIRLRGLAAIVLLAGLAAAVVGGRGIATAPARAAVDTWAGGYEIVGGPGVLSVWPVRLRIQLVRGSSGQVVALRRNGRQAARLPLVTEGAEFSNGDVRLAGKLVRPAGPDPLAAVVLVPGSVRATRATYDLWGMFFASEGLAVLSYDKRGVGG